MSETCSIEPLPTTLCTACGSVRYSEASWFGSIGEFRYSYDHLYPNDCIKVLCQRIAALEKAVSE